MEGLLLKEVVGRAELDRRTARYVLDHLSKLAIVPADGQGVHRRFGIDEAVRLALSTRLVMHGVTLALAEELTVWCEKTWRNRTRGSRGHHLFDGDTPWLLSLVNGRFVRVSPARAKKGDNTLHDDDAYFDAVERKPVGEVDCERPDLPRLTWSLTAMAGRLAK